MDTSALEIELALAESGYPNREQGVVARGTRRWQRAATAAVLLGLSPIAMLTLFFTLPAVLIIVPFLVLELIGPLRDHYRHARTVIRQPTWAHQH